MPGLKVNLHYAGCVRVCRKLNRNEHERNQKRGNSCKYLEEWTVNVAEGRGCWTKRAIYAERSLIRQDKTKPYPGQKDYEVSNVLGRRRGKTELMRRPIHSQNGLDLFSPLLIAKYSNQDMFFVNLFKLSICFCSSDKKKRVGACSGSTDFIQ